MVLSYYDFIHIDNSEYLSNTLSFIFYWLLFSLPIYYSPFLKKHKAISLKYFSLIVLFVLVLVNDANSEMIDNPITIIGIISIGLLFASTLASNFFKKNALLIIAFYVLVLSYFTYLRVYIDDINVYLQQEKEIKIILSIPFLGLILGWFFQQWKWVKTLESKKTKAELSLLKNQINPHFFFNTLNNLYGLTVEKSDDAPSVVLKLSDMMRYTIYMSKKEFIPLKDEVEYLKNYIDLHKIRYQKKVDIQFTYSNVTDYQIAPLLYVIALENAFKHGAEKLTENAFIHVNLSTSEGTILFEIENNFEKPESKQDSGIGLDNLKQRLQLLYTNKYELITESNNSVYKFILKLDTK
jgi:hypothetical protein